MAIFAVHYEYTHDHAGRDTHRAAHRDFLASLGESGLARGPYTDLEKPGALLIFEGESAEQLGAVLDADPFYTEGLIAERRIQQWDAVAGSWLR